MIFGKKENAPRPEKVRVKKVGTHRKTAIFLWLVLIGSVGFGVYKNFTAIDRHTIHEKEVIEQRIIDTNKIEQFTKDFAKAYYSWENTQESIANRAAEIASYLTNELQNLNADTVRVDIPTSSTVKDVKIWNVNQIAADKFAVTYEVVQTISEGEQQKQVTSACYAIKIHADDSGDMVIVQNPTLASQPKKSSYEPKVQDADQTVDADTMNEVSEFLETFFKLYPAATKKELAYYVEAGVLMPVSGDYLFSELINPTYTTSGEQVKVSVAVKFLDQKTKAAQISQYDLILKKMGNWKIVN